jgi:methylmalonyl-CoA mutase N-terminal domain/subunit
MGYDSDHPASEGEVGKCGVAIDSLEDMEILFDGINLEKTTVSMTINSPASVLWAMYLVVAEKQGADWKKISGTVQNDILKEYIAQKEYIYPPAPSMRLVVDTFEFGSKFTPLQHDFDQWLPIREAGSTALELAFTISTASSMGMGAEAGLDFDEFGPRLSFSTRITTSLKKLPSIERHAKSGTAWKDRFGARMPTWLMRFHTQRSAYLPAQHR